MVRLLLLAFVCSVALAQDGDSMRRSKLRVVSGSTQTFLINQTFEGTGYDNSETWSEGAGTPNEDYTSVVLDGSQSLYMNGTAATQSTDSPNFGDTGEFYFKFYFRPVTLPGAAREIIRFQLNAAQSGVSELQINSSGQLVYFNGTASTTTVSGMTAGNDYTIWGYFKKGTGSDGIATVAWAPKTGSETKPTSDGGGVGYANKTNCNGTADVDQFRVTAQFSTSGPEYVMDKLQVSTTDIQ